MEVGQRFIPMGLFTGIFIPDCIKRNTDLSTTDKMVWGQLNSCAGKNGECYPKQTTIAEELGISERTVRNSIATLVNLGFLEIEKPFGKDKLLHMNNRYFFIWNAVYESTTPTGKLCRPELASLAAPNKGVNVKGENKDKTPTPLLVKPTINRPTRPIIKYIHLFPENFQFNERFKSVWVDFVDYKSTDKKGKPVLFKEQTAKGMRTKILEISKNNVDDASELIEGVMSRGWVGIYPLEQNNQTNVNTPTRVQEEIKPVRKGPRVGCDPHGRD